MLQAKPFSCECYALLLQKMPAIYLCGRGKEMSDFTKEELDFLLWMVNEVRCDHPISHKLQSLIDNYCEHDWQKGGVRGYCVKCDSTK